jgi:hypothetical protein
VVRRPSLTIRVPVGADPDAAQAAFRADPGGWLPRPARPRGPGRWSVTLRAGPLARTVACEVGPVWEIDYVPRRRLSWAAEDESGEALPLGGALPVLHGELALEVVDGRPELVLTADYVPPGGALGAAADRAALHRVAVGTARRFTSEVIDRLVSPASADQSANQR